VSLRFYTSYILKKRKSMKLLLLFFCLFSISLAKHGKCTSEDALIHKKIGHEFSHRFRAFGGMTVSKSSYEASVRQDTGLSTPCSQCYGDAYICGYDNCFWSCSTEGASCDDCLKKEGCIKNCNECTGFVLKK
jgi:hypothetical protein